MNLVFLDVQHSMESPFQLTILDESFDTGANVIAFVGLAFRAQFTFGI
jgi:hypothetical protein